MGGFGEYTSGTSEYDLLSSSPLALGSILGSVSLPTTSSSIVSAIEGAPREGFYTMGVPFSVVVVGGLGGLLDCIVHHHIP